jgi:hypothetical protein
MTPNPKKTNLKMSAQHKSNVTETSKTPAKSIKLEMTEEQLNMMVYMLGAIDLRTEPETLQIELDLRKKLSNALKVFKPKNKPTLDRYGKPMSDEEVKKAQEVAAKAAPAQAKQVQEKV